MCMREEKEIYIYIYVKEKRFGKVKTFPEYIITYSIKQIDFSESVY